MLAVTESKVITPHKVSRTSRIDSLFLPAAAAIDLFNHHRKSIRMFSVAALMRDVIDYRRVSLRWGYSSLDFFLGMLIPGSHYCMIAALQGVCGLFLAGCIALEPL